ncbi:MAG: hypothetical protein GQ527_03770 [Bacteroidales bacterium]|nr:hypothetical protein [Bacteroidales bacterium]
MSWLLISLLIMSGLILLILEILVVPGTTVVGIIGFILMSVGIWYSFTSHGVMEGSLVLSATGLITFAAIYYSLKSKTWERAKLHATIDSKVNTEADQLNIGEVGQTISRINPMGKAIFNNEFYEVSSFGEMIDENLEIKIVDIKGSKITVVPVEPSDK